MDWAKEAAKYGGTTGDATNPEGKDWAAEARKYGGSVAADESVSRETTPVQNSGLPGKLMEALKNAGMGAVKGSSDIGASLLYPVDKTLDLVKGDREPNLSGLITGKQPLSRNQERRQQLGSFFQENADPDSLAFKTGEIGAQIAGTSGVGGALGAGLGLVSKTPKALQLAEALRTAGMAKNVPTMTNVLGGAAQAGLGTALVDPSQTMTGAGIGAVLPGVARALPAIGSGVANLVGGLGTHTGGESLKTAARAGIAGGKTAQIFTDNMRGNVEMTDVLDAARANLQKMGQAKSQAYRSGMMDISGDKTVLGFNNIDKALQDAKSVVNYKGQVKNNKGAQILQAIGEEISNWKNLDPAEFHTPEGLDALKQKIGGIVESIPFEEKTAGKIGRDLYNSVKSEITTQAPAYAKVMGDYTKASEQISEIERGLSLGKKSSNDTAMRKLQSLTRNNVNTNYGNRLDLAQLLEQQGGQEILPALSGQSLNSWTPRGIGGAFGGATSIGLGAINPLLAGTLLLQSPRLMGEVAYGVGKSAHPLSDLMKKAPYAIPALLNSTRSNNP